MIAKDQAEGRWAEIEKAILEHPSNQLILRITPRAHRDLYRTDLVFIDRLTDRSDGGKDRHTYLAGRWSGWSLSKEDKVEIVRDSTLADPGWVLEARES